MKMFMVHNGVFLSARFVSNQWNSVTSLIIYVYILRTRVLTDKFIRFVDIQITILLTSQQSINE